MYFLLFSIIFIHVHVKLVFVDCCAPGEYGIWSPWEHCNQTCGGGIERRWRSVCCPTVNGNWYNCLAEHNKTEKFNFEYRPCSETCSNGGTFIIGTGCVCSAGYEGRCCSTDIDECQSNPCQHGTCQNLVNSYTCTCNVGYTGYNCDTGNGIFAKVAFHRGDFLLEYVRERIDGLEAVRRDKKYSRKQQKHKFKICSVFDFEYHQKKY